MTIAAVIFDYGGVIWDMAFGESRALEQQHGLQPRSISRTLYASETWRNLEIGIGDRESWLAEAHMDLEREAGKPVPPLHRVWRESQQLIAPNIELIERLRTRYKTAVLSNADRTLLHTIKHEHRIDHLFDVIVCSADVGMAKPEERIYALTARRLGVSPESCVFVDDLAANVEGARAAGMLGVHFLIDEGHDLAAQLAALGVATA
jgi:putative hydrolase of the HAD superfamily